MTPLAFYLPAIEFARGFTAAIVMRPGIGGSGGNFAEGSGLCADPNYVRSAEASVVDLTAAISFLARRLCHGGTERGAAARSRCRR
jgi:hypothetical protein